MISTPTFNPYPPARQEWSFATDETGQHLQSLWGRVLAEEHQPLADRADFLPFVKALGRACLSLHDTPTHTAGVDEVDAGHLSTATPASPPHPPFLYTPSAATIGDETGELRCHPSSSAPAAVADPGTTSAAHVISIGVLRGLADVVLSVAVCSRCGQQLRRHGSTSDACCKHGVEQSRLWWPPLPTGEDGQGELDGNDVVEAFAFASADGCGVEDTDNTVATDRVADDGVSDGANTYRLFVRRRESLVQTLRALNATTKRSHTRHELARWSRTSGDGGSGAGDVATGLALFMDALCVRVEELGRRWSGHFRSGVVAVKSEADRYEH